MRMDCEQNMGNQYFNEEINQNTNDDIFFEEDDQQELRSLRSRFGGSNMPSLTDQLDIFNHANSKIIQNQHIEFDRMGSKISKIQTEEQHRGRCRGVAGTGTKVDLYRNARQGTGGGGSGGSESWQRQNGFQHWSPRLMASNNPYQNQDQRYNDDHRDYNQNNKIFIKNNQNHQIKTKVIPQNLKFENQQEKEDEYVEGQNIYQQQRIQEEEEEEYGQIMSKAAVAASLFTNSSLKSNSNYKHPLCKLTNNKEVYEVGEGGGHASAGAHSYSSANEKDDGLLRGGLSKHYQILVSNRQRHFSNDRQHRNRFSNKDYYNNYNCYMDEDAEHELYSQGLLLNQTQSNIYGQNSGGEEQEEEEGGQHSHFHDFNNNNHMEDSRGVCCDQSGHGIQSPSIFGQFSNQNINKRQNNIQNSQKQLQILPVKIEDIKTRHRVRQVNEGDEEREMEINNYEDDRRFSVQGYCISDKDFQINQNNFLKGI